MIYPQALPHRLTVFLQERTSMTPFCDPWTEVRGKNSRWEVSDDFSLIFANSPSSWLTRRCLTLRFRLWSFFFHIAVATWLPRGCHVLLRMKGAPPQETAWSQFLNWVTVESSGTKALHSSPQFSRPRHYFVEPLHRMNQLINMFVFMDSCICFCCFPGIIAYFARYRPPSKMPWQNCTAW